MLIKQENIFQEEFYLQPQPLIGCSSHRSGSGWLITECQTKKCLSCTGKPVKCMTFGICLTAQHLAALWGHSKV